MGAFESTQWSVVLAAGDSQSPESRQALEKLCRAYWKPLYAYVRSRGYSAEDAQDLVQTCFARLLERKLLKRADAARGKFRTFLLTSLQRFLADEWDKARAARRGGGVVPIRIDPMAAVPANDISPDLAFDRQWALSVLELALDALRIEMHDDGKSALFDTLKGHITGDGPASYADLAQSLGME